MMKKQIISKICVYTCVQTYVEEISTMYLLVGIGRYRYLISIEDEKPRKYI